MPGSSIAIVTPCFNEGNTAIAFLKDLENVIGKLNEQFIVVVVDDCSVDQTIDLLNQFHFDSKNISYHLLSLKFNLGHQGAIYQGLLYVNALDVSHTIVMDSDGEDDPAAIRALLEHKQFEIVQIKRGKRSEGITFLVLYFFYKLLFKAITGNVLDFGNYCMINKKVLERVSYTSFVHLPAYLLKQKEVKKKIKWNRNQRIDGKSKMSFTSLFFHAFKSLIEFAENLLMLFMRMFVFIILLLVILLGNVLYQKFIANTAILGWASTLGMGLLTLAVLCGGFFILGVLLLNLIHQQNRTTYKEVFTVLKSG